jgi:alpha-ketoglutarate-dependent taurine dioxygenase
MSQFTEYTLTEQEKLTLSKACDEIYGDGHVLVQEELIDKCKIAADKFSEDLKDLKKSISQLRNYKSSSGLLILKNLPIHLQPDSIIGIVGFLLGDVVKYPGEGDFIIQIKEVATKAGERPSFKDSKEFYLHSDLSYVENPPHFFLLHSIVNDVSRGGMSTFCNIQDTVNELSNLAVIELQKNEYEFPAPKHFLSQGFVLFPILSKDATNQLRWRIRFRRDNLRSLTRPGIDSIVELIKALRKNMFELSLEDNMIAIIDNWAYLHGRTSFINSPKPRWLNRTYVN